MARRTEEWCSACILVMLVAGHCQAEEPSDALAAALLNGAKADDAVQKVLADRQVVIAALKTVLRTFTRSDQEAHLHAALRLAGAVRATEVVEDLIRLISVIGIDERKLPLCGGLNAISAAFEYPAQDALVQIGLPAVRPLIRVLECGAEDDEPRNTFVRNVLIRVLGKHAPEYVRERIQEYDCQASLTPVELGRCENLKRQLTWLERDLRRLDRQTRAVSVPAKKDM